MKMDAYGWSLFNGTNLGDGLGKIWGMGSFLFKWVMTLEITKHPLYHLILQESISNLQRYQLKK